VRVLVDTSVWADFFNGHANPQTDVLARLIVDEVELVTCGLVIAEFFQGIRRSSTIPELERQFRDIEWLTPREPETYLAAAALFRDLRSIGITIRSTIDCLLVVLAAEHDVFLLARDRDLRQILESGRTRARPLPM
jgi:predicted nucleic acid-binding protein